MNRAPELIVGVIAGAGIGFILGSYMGGAMLPWTSAEPRPIVHQAVPVEPLERPVEATLLGEGVENPGTYELSSDSQVIDLIDEAGGLTRGAITDGIPWDESLYDGFSLSVPTETVLREVASGERPLQTEDLMYFRGDPRSTGSTAEEKEGLININRADRHELEDLYGVGPGLAGRIVRHREEIGGFEHPEQLMDIPGIGEVTFQKMRPDVEL